jgi:polysaccharide biosynthesis transport protein
MNDQGGSFPNRGAVLPFDHGGGLPALSGLSEVAFAQRPKSDNRFDLNEMWRISRRWWWLIAAITLACLLAAIAVSLMITAEYRAQSTIEVNPEGVQVVQMGELQPMDTSDREFINTQTGLLRSRSLAERVARSTNLGNNEEFVSQDLPRERRDAIATSLLLGTVNIASERDSRLITISAESIDPRMAARVANSYADNFIQATLERRYEATSYARNFLQQRIASVKGKLEESERALVAYAQREGIITLTVDSGGADSPKSEQSIDAASLISLNEALSTARSERIASEQRYRQASGAAAAVTVIANPTIQILQQQRAQLESEYQQKLSLYKPEFPEMVQLRSRIDSLAGEIARQSKNVAGSTSASMRAEYAAAVARENALQARVDQLKSDLMSLRERSIQYTILQREVDTNRSLYDALLQRFKEVGVAGGVGANVVSIVDRAQVPGSPASSSASAPPSRSSGSTTRSRRRRT